MSCHTWAYTPLKEEDVNKFKASLLDQITYWPCIPLEGESHEDYLIRRKKELEECFSYETQEEKDEDIANVLADNDRDFENYKTYANFLKSDHNLQEFHNRIADFGEYYYWSTFPVINGRIYKECGYDIPVRIRNYPEETFTDAEEFIKWIKENNIKPEYDGHEISLDSTAKMIREFWAEHNNEVYVEFG